MNESVNRKYSLLFTVVGQRALFKGFFEKVLIHFQYGTSEQTILGIQQQYTASINEAISALDSASLFLFGDSVVDLTDIMDDRLLELGTISSSFWEGILFEEDRIIYNSQGVKVFSDVLNFITKCTEYAKKGSDKDDLIQYNFRFANLRTKRLLKKRFANRSEGEYDELAAIILRKKKSFLIDKIYNTTQS